MGYFLNKVSNTVKLMQAHLRDDVPSLVIDGSICDFKILPLVTLNPILVLVLVPVLDLLVSPVLRYMMLHPSILKRLGLGAICTLLSTLSLLALEGIGERYFNMDSAACILYGHSVVEGQTELSSYWLILPIILLTLAEIFIYIPGM